MTIFDIQKEWLLDLSDTQLEELVARLAEAEVASCGYCPSNVHWSGSINAPDGGVDIRADVQGAEFSTGFLPRPNTIFQAKKHGMPSSSIMKEMCPSGVLLEEISRQAERLGSFIIVSLADDCSPPMKQARLDAMQLAVENDPHSEKLHLDFYDRSKLLLWLRQHPAVIVWVRDIISRPLSGWQPYGSWSNPPSGADDTLILDGGVSVILPGQARTKLNIADAIEPTRKLIRASDKAIRIMGLSGVGKTRFVQALFDETLGEAPLDRTRAVYVDTGADPGPSARAMLERLIAEERSAILVLDNCPSDLHAALASKISAAGDNIRLVTVEYDIRDDKPQTTEVVRIEADGPEIAEKLVSRRFPRIGQTNARKIAEFSNGNARVSLAVAERVKAGESLAQLSDADLFDRLFTQRNQADGLLRSHAEALSLVYSFSVATEDEGKDELSVLGSIYDVPRAQLYRSVSALLARDIAQKRSHWRAILPHAIANRLAGEALSSIPVETLRSVFEAAGNDRLLQSFAHRLGLMHDHNVAQDIVRSWLQPGSLLGNIAELDDAKTKILDFVAPVAPDAVLDLIDSEISSPQFNGMEPIRDARRTTVLSLIVSLAYEPEYFERCISLLLIVSDYEETTNNYDSVRDKILQLFQAYLSGTHASLEQRAAAIKDTILSRDENRRDMGFQMLSKALGERWMSMGAEEFGARPRDFGSEPNYEELVEWRKRFVDIAVEFGSSNDEALSGLARVTLARRFRGLWWQEGIRDHLIQAAKRLNDTEPWVEGWKAVRETLYFDSKQDDKYDQIAPDIKALAGLEKELAPADLMSNIRTYIVSKNRIDWSLDDDFENDNAEKYTESRGRFETKAEGLGEIFADLGLPILLLGSELFSTEYMPYRDAFGRGLAKGSADRNVMWTDLVTEFKKVDSDNFNYSVLSGFIYGVNEIDEHEAQDLLERCLNNPTLRRVLVGLHPATSFDGPDLNRCMKALEHENVLAWDYGGLFWRKHACDLPKQKLIELANQILTKPNGDHILVEALSMKLHNTDRSVDTLGNQLRKIGLISATSRLLSNKDHSHNSIDHDMERVIGAALSFEGNEDEKEAWLDCIFSVVDSTYGYMHDFDKTVITTAAKCPIEFLERIFAGDETSRKRRRFFLEHGGMGCRPLSGIDDKTLFRWSKDRNDPEVWPIVASGITKWQTNEKEKTVRLADTAIALLEAAPDPEAILMVIGHGIEPKVSSGNRSDIMDQRAECIKSLFNHPNPAISKAAKRVFSETTKWINAERVREKRRDEKQEQTFE